MSQLSVILPIYNCEKYLAPAIDSILNQNFTDFELLLLNDGSTDGSLEVAQSYSDSRIRLINSVKNQGLIRTLNDGIALAKGQYICRMDADDICSLERFEKQVQYFDENPDVSIVGTNAILIDKDGNAFGKNTEMPLASNFVECMLTRSSGVLHPSVMLRREVYENFQYDTNYSHAEDYELWTRISFSYKIANLPEKLLYYRVHESSVSKSQASVQSDTSCKIAQSYIEKRFGLSLPINFVQFYFNPEKYWYENALSPLTELHTRMVKKYPDCSHLIRNEFFVVLFKMYLVTLRRGKLLQSFAMLTRLVSWFSFKGLVRICIAFYNRLMGKL